jgi:hypothetical protein
MNQKILKAELEKKVDLNKTKIYNPNDCTFYEANNYLDEDLDKYFKPKFVTNMEDNLDFFFDKYEIEATKIFIPKTYNQYGGSKYQAFDFTNKEELCLFSDNDSINYDDNPKIFEEYYDYCLDLTMSDEKVQDKIRNEDEYEINSFEEFYDLFMDDILDDYSNEKELIEDLIK